MHSGLVQARIRKNLGAIGVRYRVKDRTTLGVVAGLIGGIPSRLLNTWEFHRGYTDFRYSDLASSLFSPRVRKAGLSSWTGRIANQLLLATTGVVITYVLSATGRDRAILKGVGVSSLEWLGLYGLAQKTGLTNYKKPLSDLLAFADHAIQGATIGSLVAMFGDESLFPDADQQLPLMGQSTPETAEVRSTRKVFVRRGV